LDPLHSVLINGQDFKIRENLWQALVHLQLEDKGLLIWIDAICINQEDIYERNEQVRMMRTIFETAEEVCVWLGLEYDDSNRAVQFLKNLDRCARDDELKLELFKHPDIGKDLEALGSLYNRNYWYRVWIVQELVLANRIWVFCGKDMVSWNAFENARKCICMASAHSELVQICFRAISYYYFKIIRSRTRGPMPIVEIRSLFRKRELGLLETASGNWPRRASDPRDFIYGILGIINVKANQAIDPDYSKSVAKVYSDFARFVVLDSKRLDILLVVRNNGSNMEVIPSWVPAWLGKPRGHTYLHPLPSNDAPRWDASGGTTAQCSFTGEDRFLVTAGLNIGIISRTRASTYRDEQDKGKCIIDTFFDWLSIIEDIGGDRHENTYALAETFSKGHFLSKGRSRLELEGMVGAFVRLGAKNSAAPIDPRLREYLTFNDEPSDLKDELDLRYEILIMDASNRVWDRRLILSDSGWFGIGPGTATEGDILCIPLGCMSPVVLRPYEGYYTLIGETYVHGFMHGEAIELLEEGKLKVQHFEIH
jgi:hypothetical protein